LATAHYLYALLLLLPLILAFGGSCQDPKFITWLVPHRLATAQYLYALLLLLPLVLAFGGSYQLANIYKLAAASSSGNSPHDPA